MKKPATELPFASETRQFRINLVGGQRGRIIAATGRVDETAQDDMTYIAHAANAYPKLVEALRDLSAQVARVAAENKHVAASGLHCLGPSERAAALLRELGEGS